MVKVDLFVFYRFGETICTKVLCFDLNRNKQEEMILLCNSSDSVAKEEIQGGKKKNENMFMNNKKEFFYFDNFFCSFPYIEHSLNIFCLQSPFVFSINVEFDLHSFAQC